MIIVTDVFELPKSMLLELQLSFCTFFHFWVFLLESECAASWISLWVRGPVTKPALVLDRFSGVMASTPWNNVWIRRQQCPCGDWKCYVACEGENEETAVASEFANAKAETPEALIPPYVGMTFKSDDDAFEYYSKFARKNGFSIRKDRSRLSPQLGIYKRDFVCYRSGFAPAKKRATGEHHRDRKSIRCGCDAKMYLSKEVVDGVLQWFVVQFSNVHNHELLENDQVRLLPAYRKIREADQERILLLCKAGFPINRIMKVLELEKGIQGGHLPFLEKDVRNFVQSRKKVVQENDALLNEKRETEVLELFEACKALKEVDEGFTFDYTMDEDDQVENIAWSYGNSVVDCTLFGDVVYFDTSYQSITYRSLFGAWFGIDNRGRTIFFGCALLQDETPRSFGWALQTFIRFMKGRLPQTILTDLDPGLRDAVRSELSSTKQIVPLSNVVTKVRVSATFLNQSHREMQYMPSKAYLPIEEHAQSVLTPFAFNALQHELVQALQYAMSEMADGSYVVRHYKKIDGEYLVIWRLEEEQIRCSCKEFESSGTLCRHALRVFIGKNCFQIPSKYFLRRWRRESSLVAYDNHARLYDDDDWFQEYQSLVETLFTESSLTKERSDYVRRELVREARRILDKVRSMPESDSIPVDTVPSPTG